MTNSTSNERPIFIVGTSRSGTALMQSVLNNHPEVLLAGETHYFDDLRVKMAGYEQTALNSEQATCCENYFLALAHRPYGHAGDPNQSRIDRAELRALAESLGPGADSYFEASCRLRANKQNKRRWGEKTPRHVFRITEILARYPSAQVICMVRDPRAVVASKRDGKLKKKFYFNFQRDPGHAMAIKLDQQRAAKSYHILIASLLWRSSLRATAEARKQFGADHVWIQRYEDLVVNADVAVRAVLAWLSLEYHASVLDVPMRNSTFSKFEAHAGLSSEPLHRWRNKLTAAETAVIQWCCGRRLVDAGYEPEPVSVSLPLIVWHWMTLPFALVSALLANRGRIGNIPAYVWRRFHLAAAPFSRSHRDHAAGRIAAPATHTHGERAHRD